MDPFTEDFSRAEEITMLTQEDDSEETVDTNDEVETLQNSFLEAVRDDNIQPKMQCLMMDSSFSMVTMQGEDSGIEWETTPSRCNTPWASEAGPLSADLSTITAMSPAPPGTSSAGKIIFVMDEDLISKQKKAKEKGQKHKGKAAIQPLIIGSSDNISGRPELVGFSEPNVQAETDEHVETDRDPINDKEQKLFRLVSEGSEILNIIVPSKVVTVDEEESKGIEDNLSYLSSTVIKANIDFPDQTFEWQNEGLPTPVSSELGSAVSPPTTDPPGAPVPKTPLKQPANVDYFDAFALIDAQAPGGPAVTEQEHYKPDKASRALDTEQPAKTSSHTTLTTEEHADISLVEMTSELLLDDVFYGNTDNCSKTSEKAGDFKRVPSRLSSKLSGATLFGSQEDILTPIYLPEGPPKIIDQILLEEPKAMAFLYTDLYEEAIGSRKKEEDTESMSSEKSFHSRHSDREARGYLEKYVLIDETPVVGVEENKTVQCPKDTPRTITQNVYEFDTMVTKPPKENNVITSEEEEVTDFFRSSANSSPCFSEPLSRTAEEEEDETTTKAKTKTNKKHVVTVAETAPEQSSDSLTEFPLDDPVWESAFEDVISACGKEEVAQTLQHVEMPSSVGPAQQKAAALQKVSLDLAPLTPVDVQEEMEACAKEEREEEKETASPTETADEGDGDETNKTCTEPVPAQNTTAFDETTDACNRPETKTVIETCSQIENAAFEENSGTLEASMTREIESSEETQNVSTPVPHVEVKETGKCTIL